MSNVEPLFAETSQYTSLDDLFKKMKRMKKIRWRKLAQVQNRWLMPVFHPSYVLRNLSNAADAPCTQMEQDFHKVHQKYDVLMNQ